MNITPEKKTVKELLKSQKQFVIPRFQREFVWDGKQYETFLYDVIKSLSVSSERIIVNQYFIGTMLFIGSFTDGSKREMKVVDGQQRITTITILFSAMARIFEKKGEKELASLLFDYIMTKDDDNNPVRVLKTETSHPYFANYIQRKDGTPQSPCSEEEENIEEVFQYFLSVLEEKKIRALYKKIHMVSNKEIKYLDLLKSIRDAVLNCLTVCITTENNSDASKLFEILNGKGKSLNYIDLIKNRLFDTLNDTEPSDYAADKWKQMNDNLVFDDGFIEPFVYVRHYWLSKYCTVSKSHLYDKFLKIKTTEYHAFLGELSENSSYYQLALNPTLDYFDKRKEYCEVVQYLNCLNWFDVIQPRIAIMALLDSKKKNLINQSKLTEVVRSLSDFHFVYNSVMSLRPNKLDKIYSKFAIELRKADSKNSVNAIIKEKLYDPLKNLLPGAMAFYQEFVKLSFQKNNSQDNVKAKYAINRIALLQSSEKVFAQSGSIEHLVPEYEGDNAYNIGNLILLEVDLNGEAGSLPYKDKRAIYNKSSYRWITGFSVNHESFEKKDITSRAYELATVFYDGFIRHFGERKI